MKSLSVRSLDGVILSALVILGAAVVFSFALMPRSAHATAVTVTAFTATSTPAYTNPGLATTTRAKIADTIQYQLTLSGGAPLISPQINILGTGSTTMSGSGVDWYYATTTTSNASVWNDGLVTFKVSVGNATDVGIATTTVTAVTSGSNITFDKTAPTLSSVVWTDTDSSKQFSATDTFLLTWSETMATTTLTAGDINTVLGLTNSHTFSTTTAPTWNTAGTQLTITLGAGTTVTGADTVQPTTAVKDAIGNTASGAQTAKALGDNLPPADPTGLSDTSFHGAISVSISSSGSSQIRYTTDGSTPACPSTGTVYSSAITIPSSLTLKAIGCDEAGNPSSVVTAVYTHHSGGGGGPRCAAGTAYNPSTSSCVPVGGETPATPAVPATHLEGCVPGSGDLFDTTSGKSCTVSATPASPSEGCASGNLFNTENGKSCTESTTSTTSASPSSSGESATSGAGHEFKSDLTVGSRGSEVMALQLFLNAHGYVITTSGGGSPGHETTYFGGLTRAAVMKYQKAKGIAPVAGYFGAKTRASVNSEQ